MSDPDLRFPDASRSELESTLGDLVERAHRVLSSQERLRSLLAANRAIMEDLDLDRVLTRIVESAVALVAARYGALGVIDPEGGLRQFIQVGMSPEEAAAIGHLPRGHGLLGAVIDTAQIVRADHLADDPRSTGFPAHHPPMDSFLGVPIRVRDEIFGSLYLADPADGPFTAEDEELVGALAATAGVAIQNARLYEEALRREKLSTALADVTAALLGPDTEDVLGVVADRTASVLPAALVTVVVPDGDDDHVRVEVARGVDSDAIEGALFPASGSLAAQAIASRKIVVSPPRKEPVIANGVRLGPRVAVPLLVGGHAIAALGVARAGDGRPFTASELDTVAGFASQAGLAIALAQARRDRQRLEVIHDRNRIARDLHDHVIQRLFATGLGLQALASVDVPHAHTLEAHIAEIDVAIGEIRTVVFALSSPRSAGPDGMRSRLLDVIAEATPTLDTTPRITFCGPVDLLLSGQLADDVVAVVREALANVARHARARSTTVEVSVTDTTVTVTIDDDGIGVRDPSGRSSGTRNLTDRAAARGGAFTLEPRSPTGTRARWTAPVSA